MMLIKCPVAQMNLRHPLLPLPFLVKVLLRHKIRHERHWLSLCRRVTWIKAVHALNATLGLTCLQDLSWNSSCIHKSTSAVEWTGLRSLIGSLSQTPAKWNTSWLKTISNSVNKLGVFIHFWLKLDIWVWAKLVKFHKEYIFTIIRYWEFFKSTFS